MFDNSKRFTNWLGWIIGLVVIVIFILVCWLLFRGEETYITEPTNDAKITAIECTSSSPESPFFTDVDASSTKHTVKITFTSNKPAKFSYNYDANFSSESAAEHAHAVFHAKYNKYMASVSLNPDSLTPSFTSGGVTAKITLMTNVEKLNNDNLLFFFLDMDDYQRIRSYNEKEFAGIYNKKGFSCEIHE